MGDDLGGGSEAGLRFQGLGLGGGGGAGLVGGGSGFMMFSGRWRVVGAFASGPGGARAGDERDTTYSGSGLHS